MDSYSKTASTFLILIIVAVITAAALPGQNQEKSSSNVQKIRGYRELPIVDYCAPEPLDAQERAERKAKGKRFDNQSSEPFQDSPHASGRVWSTYWWKGLPAIPSRESDTILVGEISGAQAYLSNDKTGIYSEFTVLVEEVLKGDLNTPFVSGGTVTIERFGGAVRFPSGRIQKDETTGQGMPRVGCRYILFLKHLDQEDGFSLVTGYELRGERVFPLDGASVEEGTQKFPFDEYEASDSSTFLKLVRDAIGQTP